MCHQGGRARRFQICVSMDGQARCVKGVCICLKSCAPAPPTPVALPPAFMLGGATCGCLTPCVPMPPTPCRHQFHTCGFAPAFKLRRATYAPHPMPPTPWPHPCPHTCGFAPCIHAGARHLGRRGSDSGSNVRCHLLCMPPTPWPHQPHTWSFGPCVHAGGRHLSPPSHASHTQVATPVPTPVALPPAFMLGRATWGGVAAAAISAATS